MLEAAFVIALFFCTWGFGNSNKSGKDATHCEQYLQYKVCIRRYLLFVY